MKMQQWTYEQPLADLEVKRWRTVARQRLTEFADQLRKYGETPRYAPEMPKLTDGWEGFIEQPYRFLMTWVPDWAPNHHAGKHVFRIDTLT